MPRPPAIAAFLALVTLSGGVAAQATQGAAVATMPPPRIDAKVLSAVRAGDAAAALRALGERTGAPRDYLRARLLQRLGRYAEAEQRLGAALSSAGGLPDAIAADARLRRAHLLARLGRFDAALKAAEALPDGPAVVALRAESCLAAGQHRLALGLFQQALGDAGGQDVAALSYGLAQAQRAAGDPDAAAATLHALLLKHPLSPVVEPATAMLSQLGKDFSPTPLERIERAERLLAGYAPERALQALQGPIAPLAPDDRARLLHVRGMAMFKMRTRYADAAQALARAARLGGPYVATDAFHAARALSRADRDRAAVRAYRRFIKRHPGHRLAHRAEYLAGWLSVRHGFAGGVAALSAFAQGPGGAALPGLARSATFHLAMHAFDRRRFGDARKLFDRYGRIAGSAMDRARGRYWAGRAAQRAHNPAAAVQHYLDAQSIDPLHYYALLSQARLGELGKASAVPFEVAPGQDSPSASAGSAGSAGSAASASPAPPDTSRWPEAARFYMAVGLDDDAARTLHSARRQLLADDAVGARGLALAYLQLGAHGRSFRVVAGHADASLRRVPAGDDLWAWQASYPRPYPAQVTALSAHEGLSPEHVYAIMRKESAFDPTVASSADALGLLQLLPKTGARIARQLGIPFSREALFDPATNLRLGIRHIAELWRRFDGHPVLAIAAFNAGGHRVDEWCARATRRARGKPVEVDRFVESIPIDQTRNYVRRVLTYWAHYRYLAAPAAGFPGPLPAEVAPVAPVAPVPAMGASPSR